MIMSLNDDNVLYVRSTKSQIKGSSGDDTSTNDDDVWDDTLLIEAYDKAVKLTQDQITKRMQSKDKGKDTQHNSKHKKETQEHWKVGDKCRCQYSEDHLYYEADVIEIIDAIGMCIVKYVGYENEEKVPLKKLMPSLGEAARIQQIQQSLKDNEETFNNFNELDSENDAKNVSHGKRKKKNKKKDKLPNVNDKSFMHTNGHHYNPPTFPSPMEHMVIPPPPPPCVFTNGNEEDSESEAMTAMLMSWYMSGYHTGYYQGLKNAKK